MKTGMGFRHIRSLEIKLISTNNSISELTMSINKLLADNIHASWKQAFQLMIELFDKGENGLPFDQQVILAPQGIENLIISLQHLADVMQPLKGELQLNVINPTMPINN